VCVYVCVVCVMCVCVVWVYVWCVCVMCVCVVGVCVWCVYVCCVCVLCIFVFQDKVSLYSPGCPGTHSVHQPGLELREIRLPPPPG